MLRRRLLLLPSLALLLSACGAAAPVRETAAATEAPTEAATQAELIGSPPASALPAVRLEITNKTGASICVATVTESSASSYGANLLGKALDEGQTFEYVAPRPGMYDFSAASCDLKVKSIDERIGNSLDYGQTVWEIGSRVYVAQAAPLPPPPGQPGAGAVGVDFAPARDGLSFPNFTTEYPEGNVDLDGMRHIFGDDVCQSLGGGICIPRPDVQLLIDSLNKAMASGHCEGFTVVALRLFNGRIKPGDFTPGAGQPFDIKPGGAIVRQISTDYVLQITSEYREVQIKGTPTDIVKALLALKQPVALGIRSPRGGHSLLAYKVEDKGSGLYWIWVYDNNWPGQANYLEVDTKSDSWRYSLAATNPSSDPDAWTGDASTQTLAFVPFSALSLPRYCLNCLEQSSSLPAGIMARPSLAAAGSTTLMAVSGQARVLYTDEIGRQTGYLDGKYINDIPGAQLVYLSGGQVNGGEPWVVMPSNARVSVTLDPRYAKGMTRASFSAINQGFSFSASGVGLGGGQKAQIDFSPGDRTVSFKPGGKSRPSMQLGLSDGQKAYLFSLGGASFDQKQGVDFGIDPATGRLIVKGQNLGDEKFTFAMAMIDERGAHLFATNALELSGSGALAFDYGAWSGEGPLQVEHDAEGNGAFELVAPAEDVPLDTIVSGLGGVDDTLGVLGDMAAFMSQTEVAEYLRGWRGLGFLGLDSGQLSDVVKQTIQNLNLDPNCDCLQQLIDQAGLPVEVSSSMKDFLAELETERAAAAGASPATNTPSP